VSLPNLSLEDKVAIVTGARRDIGEAIALLFAEAGADVVVCDMVIDDGLLNTVAERIKKLGRRALAIKTDVTCQLDVDNLVQKATDELGSVDILVNNAGIYLSGIPLIDCPDSAWDKVIETDLRGYFRCARAAGKRMADQKSGNIINVASISSFKAENEGSGTYCIAKAGVVMLTKILAVELAGYNVRVNAISPGMVKTAMFIRDKDAETLKQRATLVPIGRIAEPSDIANVALFLASEASSYMTASTVLVDGGLTA